MKRDLSPDEQPEIPLEKLDDFNRRLRERWKESRDRFRDMSPEGWMAGDPDRKERMKKKLAWSPHGNVSGN